MTAADNSAPAALHAALLAVDVGLHTGLAAFSRPGTLLWFRSHHLGSPAHLRKAAARILHDTPAVEFMVVEGGGSLADIWEHAAQRRGIACMRVHAETWRRYFFPPRDRSSAAKAKDAAVRWVERFIHSEPCAHRAPRHDAAEAILIGLWALAQLGWRVPPSYTPREDV